MKIEHDREKRRFVLESEEHSGELSYREEGPEVLNFTHTYVDPELRGRGMAGRLAEAAFDYARQHDYRVVASCPFVKRWLERHPNERELLAA